MITSTKSDPDTHLTLGKSCPFACCLK